MPPTDALVSGDGWISDESSFYGDDEAVDALDARRRSFNAVEYWSTHGSLVSTIAYKARVAQDAKGNDSAVVRGAPDELVYPHEGHPLWYQPSETISEFLKRCPPDTTVMEESGIDWYWIDSPHTSARPEECPDLEAYESSGNALLEDYRKKREDLEKKNPNLRTGSITSKLFKDRENLRQQIAELARETHIVSGKWLVFPSWDDVPRLWKQVCLAVLESRLGPCAKVATKSINKNDPSGLIVIYTRNCFDIDDIRRVLLTLIDLGLASDGDDAHKIWYKMDAYTYLHLNAKNEFNLPASLYSSRDILKREGWATKRKAEEMHSSQPKSKGKQKSIADMFH